ncbi:hypothetical protein [Bradyrhizobium elkanii]|uniref:hypothetical protein n=1 Tax=Bradyrhizobium elkanii TaxID=29448 RepID=UPI00216A2524|nr:hypothetical protein [Bradyrhizobium elkanii]MCS3482422.1 hypothetical protein [Bradyrhizobium elkanii]
MAPTIVTFLGYTSPVETNGAIVEPSPSAINYDPGGWNATFNNGLLDLNLGGWIGPAHNEQRIFLVAKVDCVLSNGVWTPDSVRSGAQFWLFPNNETSIHPNIDVRLGSLDFKSNGNHGLGVRGGKIVFQNVDHTWTTDPASPLVLVNPSIPIDFKLGVAQIDRGALELVACNIRGPVTKQVKCFSRSHVSRGTVDVPLGSPPTSLSIIFDAAGNKALPLHVDVLDRKKTSVDSGNPMVAALSITSYALRLNLRRSGADTIATAVSALATGASLPLTTHFLSNRQNAASLWSGPASLALGVRAGDTVRPASLFIISPTLALQPSSVTSVHGVASDAEFAFQGPATFLLDTASEPHHPKPKGFDPPIAREITYPYLRWPNLAGMSTKPVTLMHAGKSTVVGHAAGSAGAAIEPVGLSGSTLALPLLDRPRLVQTGTSGNAHIKFLDGLLASPSYDLVETTHDSGRIMSPPGGGSTMVLSTLFAADKPTYHPFNNLYSLGDRFTLDCRDSGTTHDFLVIPQDAQFIKCNLNELLGKDSPFKMTGTPASGILKLSRGITLKEICTRVGILPPFSTDDPINSPNWVGLIMFKIAATANDGKPLVKLFGTAAFNMPYLAVTAKDSVSAFDFTGSLEYKNATPLPMPTGEANFRISNVSAFWQNSTLQKLDVDGTLNVGKFLGLNLTPPQQITITGRYDSKTASVRFASRFDPIDLLPATVQGGPIKTLRINSVDLVFNNQGTTIVAGGLISVSGFTLGSFSIDAPGSPVDFTKLAFSFDGSSGILPIDIRIDYAAIQLNQDNISYDWGSFKIALTGIAMATGPDWWSSIPVLKIGSGGPAAGPSAAVTLSLSLMKLPALAAKSVDRLTLKILVGMQPAGDNWSTNFWAAIQAVDFKGLELDLLQFATLKIKDLSMSQSGDVAEFKADGVEVEILSKRIATVTVQIFNRAGESGFLAFVAPQPISSWFQVNWLLAGHNIAIPDDIVADLITINPNGGDDTDQLGTDLANANLIPAPGQGNGSWLFGAGIHIADQVLLGRAVFQDEGFCGIALHSALLKEWFNLDISIGVAYRRGSRPEQDTFFVALTVPQVTLPAFDFMGGVISLEIAMNGDFKLDVGFPSLASNGVARSWDRCFGAVVGIFQGSGGFYLTKGTPGAVQTITGLRLGGGYAIQAGFGAAFGAGIFSVVVTIGIYAIVEGEFVLDNGKLVQFRLSGAIGVLFRGVGQLNWWVISVTVSVVVAAEARTTIEWTTGSKVNIDFDFTVYASASAQACIGGRWFHLCKSISVSIPMRVHYPVQIG